MLRCGARVALGNPRDTHIRRLVDFWRGRMHPLARLHYNHAELRCQTLSLDTGHT